MPLINPQVPPQERRYGMLLMAMYMTPTIAIVGIAVAIWLGYYTANHPYWPFVVVAGAYLVRLLARRRMNEWNDRLESEGVGQPEDVHEGP
jgi:hypothetical protein